MRNLRNIKHAALKFAENDDCLTATAWDGDDLVCTLGPSESSPTISLKRLPKDAYSPDQAITIASWDAVPPSPDLPFDKVLNLHCFPDTGSICLVLEGGDIVVVKEDGDELIEIVGSVDSGITAAAWSPDEELLTISSKANTLLFMTRDFEGTASINLSPEDLRVSNHVSVGWGKKETQFQGRGAKALKDPTVPEHMDEGRLSDFDDGRTTISWRGDGQFVAINSILDVEQKRRIIRVYSREGELDSVSEPVDGLEGALSWKPSGQLIAGIQRKTERIDVVFFERNGLRHGEFSLRLAEKEMIDVGSAIDLAWNNDSSVLAVSLKDRVQLWTMGNYHYYLKQGIMLGDTAYSFAVASWHAEKPLQMSCFAHRSVRLLNYTLEAVRGSVIPPHDRGTVAVIDGRALKITPLRSANVPPPLAFDEVELPGNALDVSISKEGTKMAVLHDEYVTLWDCDYGSKPVKKAKLSSQMSLVKDSAFTVPRQIALNENSEVVVATSGINTEGSQLACLPTGDASATVDMDGVTSLFTSTNHDRTMYENSYGAICDFSAGSRIGKLPVACPAVEVWQQDDTEITFGLTAGGTLHIQSTSQTLKIPSCTSFVVTKTHLVFTTSSHLLKFVHLHAGDLEVPPDEPEKDERCRNIERGAKMITVIPSAYSLVLQMPRGNLETIYPRALVLAGIRHEIGHRHYKKAFLICRTHRVDMNILHDYAPEQFMKDVDRFIQQVMKVEYIDLFLSSLSEEDVSQTLYKETLKTPVDDMVDGLTNGIEPQTVPASSKVNKICDAFLKALTGQETTHLQNIVSSHVCKNPPDLEAGLSLVAQLRQQQKQEQLEQAVDHICFLADVNQLYDTALGIYDLDVALLVAQQSQKDPREYLPYLQNLHDMEPLRQKHAIDNDLKGYKKALSHLHAAGEFEELKSYASKHDLYSTALELYRYDNAKLIELMRIYADFLSSRNRYKEAGIAYEYVEDYTSAYEAYRACSMWRECLACATLVDLPSSSISELASDLAESLEEAKNYIEAAAIYLDHLRDLESAVCLLCRGYQFADAIRHVATRKRPELLRDLVDPGLIEASASMTEMLAEMKTQLQNQLPRLRELRQKKAEDPMAFLDGGGDYGDSNIPDDISLAPTDSTNAGTFMTRYTNRSMGTLATNATRKTSKNKRREERKRARGKKGTVYEEEYLVNSIARLIERLNDTGEDIGRLVEGLMRRAMRERAVAVEGVFHEVVEACRGCMDEVFSSSSEQKPAVEAREEEKPTGGDGVLWEAMNAGQQKREAPLLKAFERLSLLEN